MVERRPTEASAPRSWPSTVALIVLAEGVLSIAEGDGLNWRSKSALESMFRVVVIFFLALVLLSTPSNFPAGTVFFLDENSV